MHAVGLKTYRKRQTIEKGGGRGPESSELMERHDDDDDDPSLQAGLLVYILCQYRVVAGMLFLVIQHWHVHVKGSIRECH